MRTTSYCLLRKKPPASALKALTGLEFSYSVY